MCSIGSTAQSPQHGQDPRLHPIPGLRGLVAEDGREGQRRRPVLHATKMIRAMVRVVDPKIGKTIYDPGCGTGGFLAQATSTSRRTGQTGATAEQ